MCGQAGRAKKTWWAWGVSSALPGRDEEALRGPGKGREDGQGVGVGVGPTLWAQGAARGGL